MKEINLSQNQIAIVDDQDFEALSRYKWSADKAGKHGFYAVRVTTVNGKAKKIYMHREILGILESKIHVDHINHNKLDNRRENIRIASIAENSRNRKKQHGTSSVYKGVTWFERDSRWAAQISHKGKLFRIGYYESEIDAALAYNASAKKIFGEFAKLNEIKESQSNRVTKKRIGPACGEKVSSAVLNAGIVKEIRMKYKPREYSSRKLAHEYGVSQRSILRIVRRISWKHIQ